MNPIITIRCIAFNKNCRATRTIVATYKTPPIPIGSSSTCALALIAPHWIDPSS